MTCAIDDALRSILDGAYSIAGQLGLHQYVVNVIQVTNAGGTRPGVGGTRIVNSTPLLIAGNQNPQVRTVSSNDITLSGDSLKDTDMIIGPLTLPYTTQNCIGGDGFSISFFDPAFNSGPNDTNYQLYFQIFGPALNINGNYFEKIRTEVLGAGSLTYNVYVRNLGISLP